MLSVFTYLDYRKYLRDLFRAKKEEARHFSHRFIHQKLGISASSGFIANVLAGKKNLSGSHVRKLCAILKLTGAETRFFADLVALDHTKDPVDKDELLKRIMHRQQLKLKRLMPQQQGIFSQWHYVFIRELLCFCDVGENYDDVAKLLDPPVTPAQVKGALEKLQELGLVRRDDSGCYRQSDAILSTGDEVRSLELAHFQFETMELARRALQTIPAPQRDISVVSCALSPQGFAQAKERIRALRKELLSIAENDTGQDRVYHCNLQLFPVTRERMVRK